MSTPMNPAEPFRRREILLKEDAIKRKLQTENIASKTKATKAINPKKGGQRSYDVKKIAGADKGFTKSDYGVGAGAGIPYQIQTNKSVVMKPHPEHPKTIKAKSVSDIKKAAISRKLARTKKVIPDSWMK